MTEGNGGVWERRRWIFTSTLSRPIAELLQQRTQRSTMLGGNLYRGEIEKQLHGRTA